MPAAPSVALVLYKYRPKKDGTFPVYLRVTHNRKPRYVKTGISLDQRDWNPRSQQVRRSHPLSDAYNAKLNDLRLKAELAAVETSSGKEALEIVRGRGSSFFGYLDTYIERQIRDGKHWESRKYRVLKGKLEACWGDSVDWKDVDRDAVEEFERYLRVARGNKSSTARREIQRLRSVVKRAVEDEIIRVEDDPFLIYKRPREEKVERRKLTIPEIESLRHLSLELGTTKRKARDVFVFAFYAGGMRFGDVCCLRPQDIVKDPETGRARVEYTMMKNGRPMRIPLPEQALNIIKPYEGGPMVFPLLDPSLLENAMEVRREIGRRNALLGRYLKEVAEEAELHDPKSVSMHVARHSFADYARRQSGNLYAISKTLGHSSLQITQGYLRSFDDDAIKELAESLW